MIAGSRRGLTPTMQRELKRRSAIEPTIGHMKTDGRLDRNFLLGHDGNTINALLVGVGHNLRLILAKLAPLACFIRAALNVLMMIVASCCRQPRPRILLLRGLLGCRSRTR